MFRGINSVVLDAKGRMALPARYRDALHDHCGGKLVVTIDSSERCLLLYPLPAWNEVQQRLQSLENTRRQARLMQRLLIGHATDLETDTNGRLLIPPLLREYAELKRKVVLLGQGNKLEIWSDELWQKRLDDWLKERNSEGADGGDELAGLKV